MTDEVEQSTGAEEGTPANESETEVVETTKVQEGAADGTDKEAETEEQRNERARQETAAKAEKRSQGVQKRMNELTAKNYAAERRADELAKQNAELVRAVLASKGTAQVTEAQGEPKPEQFTDYNEYVKALAIHTATQASKGIAETATRNFTEQQQRNAAIQADNAAAARYAERERTIAKDIPDFAEVMEDAASVTLPTRVIGMIRKMENGPLIAYHMAKTPALADQFNNSDPDTHGILLGQLAATLKGAAKVSNAPPPGKVVLAKPGPGTAPPEDPDAYMAWRQKNMR